MPTLQAHNSPALRPIEIADAARLFSLIDANREHLRPWLAWVDDVTCVAPVRAFCAKAVRRQAAGRAAVWVVMWQDEPAGLIELRQISRRGGDAELGYWLSQPARSHGVMTHCVAMALDHAFDTLELTRVFAECAADNTPSRRVLKRTGFTSVGRRRRGIILRGKAVETIVFVVERTRFAVHGGWRSGELVSSIRR